MTVTFDGVILADGEARTMRVASGLAPGGEVQVDPLEFLRADWAVPVARGNRLMTLPMVIEFPACATFEEALVESLMYFANLPEEGTLVIAHGAESVTFSAAVCSRCSQLQAIEGLSNGVQITFVCGEPVNATLSPLAQMDARYVANFIADPFNVTGLTGGTAGMLDSVVTADVAVGRLAQFVINVSGVDVPHLWQLVAGTDAEDAAGGIVRPDDYDATTNAKVWKQLS